MNNKTLELYEILNAYRKNPFGYVYDPKVILNKLNSMVSNQLPIKMILPACHGKAASPNCVINYLPDLGEYLGIKNFTRLCEEINLHYDYGAELILIHEGYFYTHTPLVESDEVMDAYLKNLHSLITASSSLKSMVLQDFFPQFKTNDERRQYFLENYMPSETEMDMLLKENNKYQPLYINYKKIYSKYILPQKFPHLTQRQIDREAKKMDCISCEFTSDSQN